MSKVVAVYNTRWIADPRLSQHFYEGVAISLLDGARDLLVPSPTGLFGRDGLLPDVLFWKVLAYWRSERDV